VSGVIGDDTGTELRFYFDDYHQTYLPDLIDEIWAITTR